MNRDVRRLVPRTDSLLDDPRLRAAQAVLGKPVVVDAVRAAQGRCRQGMLDPDLVADEAVACLPETASSLRRVVNATGVVVHTNLGRAPLSAAARAALDAAAGATDVELDLEDGRRGPRGRGALDALAAAVPDAEAVHVVNNCAASLALTATALAQGREIVISRGELVEIGDGFRIPELLASTGARLVEVGSTNRVTLSDYRSAVGSHTACVLKVHPSNFFVRGFTEEVSTADLATLGPPVVADIGSGLLAAHPALPEEPDAASALRSGAALVVASGDKLLGGPQCGLLLGRRALVERLRRHPFARALRVDKLALAALEATLRGPEPPVRSMLTAAPERLRERAEQIVLALPDVPARVVSSEAVVGGGGAPGVVLPSTAVSLPVDYAPLLRRCRPAIVSRVEKERCLLDLRTVDAGDDELVVEAVARVAKG